MINVDRRDWMIAMREKLEMTREAMAKPCKCSCLLLEMIEGTYSGAKVSRIQPALIIRESTKIQK